MEVEGRKLENILTTHWETARISHEGKDTITYRCSAV